MSDFSFWVILSNLLLATRWTIALSLVAFVCGGAVVIRGNLLGGGEYTLRQVPVSGGAVPEVRITGNQFRRDALAGPLQVPATSLLADNVFVDGGAVSGRG